MTTTLGLLGLPWTAAPATAAKGAEGLPAFGFRIPDFDIVQ